MRKTAYTISLIVLFAGIILTGFSCIDIWVISSKTWASSADFWKYIFNKDPNTWCLYVGVLLLVCSIISLVAISRKKR